MNFHGTTKLLQIVSHDLWAPTKKLFSSGFEILEPADVVLEQGETIP